MLAIRNRATAANPPMVITANRARLQYDFDFWGKEEPAVAGIGGGAGEGIGGADIRRGR